VPVRHTRRNTLRTAWTESSSTSQRWQVQDATGFALAYTYGDDNPQGASANKMTVDEARRIAVNIARLPDLLKAERIQPDA